MAFVGIEFNEVDDGGLAVVCSNWLTPRNREVFRPPYKTQEKYYKSLKSSEHPDETWAIYSREKQYFEVDDYDKASQKIKTAEVTSDLQCDVQDCNIRPRRRRTATRKLQESENDEENVLFEV